jgi:hypothetical protein
MFKICDTHNGTQRRAFKTPGKLMDHLRTKHKDKVNLTVCVETVEELEAIIQQAVDHELLQIQNGEAIDEEGTVVTIESLYSVATEYLLEDGSVVEMDVVEEVEVGDWGIVPYVPVPVPVAVVGSVSEATFSLAGGMAGIKIEDIEDDVLEAEIAKRRVENDKLEAEFAKRRALKKGGGKK